MAEVRKAHVWGVTVEMVIDHVREHGPVSVIEIAQHFGISAATARRKADGAVHRGELVRDDYDDAGRLLLHEHWRYGDAG